MQLTPSRRRLSFASSLLLSCVAGLLLLAAPASASHLKGGSVSAAIGADQHLTGSVELIYRSTSTCPATPGQLPGASVQVSGPSAFSASPTLTSVVMSSCLPSTKTEGGEYDLDLSSAPDGTYTVTYSNCCRVNPISNASGGSTSYTATIHKSGSTVTATPSLTSNVALGISTHAGYAQNLNATSSDGGPLTYTLLQSTTPAQPDYDATAPTTNIVSLDATGHVSIPASTTSGLTPGTAYVYKVRVATAGGDYAEREVLLVVSNNNVPVLDGPQSPVAVLVGGTTTLHFTATDPDSAQLVTILPSGLPAWATLSATAGNPAEATITLSPPADTAAQVLTINVDATDDDGTAPMTDSRALTLNVAPPLPEPTLVADTTAPDPPALLGPPNGTATSATITFSGEPGATFSCRLDGGDWTPCASPQHYAGLAVGAHSAQVRQADAAGNVSGPATVVWTVVAPPAPPAAPNARRLAVQAPEAVVATSDRPTVGCRAIGGPLTSCTVRAYVEVTHRDGTKERVLVGRGKVGAVASGSSEPVKLTLTPRGRRLLSRVGGVKVELSIAGRGTSGKTLHATDQARLLPAQTRLVTARGLFASDSPSMSASGRRYVNRLARKLHHVKTVVCTGYTDSMGNSAYNERLALARAKAVCSALRTRNPKIVVRVRSAGENRPKASNRTAAGRERNRRVELRLRYR
jgi:outer membrane protein OmpA-like peptidoglycan-associated protein